MKKIILAFLLIGTGFTACKKDPEPTTPSVPKPVDSTVSKYAALTTDKWMITAVYMAKGKDTLYDYYSTLKDCEKDNFVLFNTSSTVTSDEGATKCDPAVSQTTTDGSWGLTKDTTEFTLKDSKVLPFPGTLVTKVALINNTDFRITKDTAIVIPGVGTIDGTIFANFKKVK